MAYRIQPRELGYRVHGWISPEGTIYAGRESHDEMRQFIADRFGDEVNIGWIRFVAARNNDGKNEIGFDWLGGLYSDDSENVVRSIAKQIAFPYDTVYCDYGNYKHWKGSLDDLIKFGVKGRKIQLESFEYTDSKLIKPSDISRNTHGWITPTGNIYAGSDEHSVMINRIMERFGEEANGGDGWIRWWVSGQGKLMLDWSEFGNKTSETLSQSIVKQTTYPFSAVLVDVPKRLVPDGFKPEWMSPSGFGGGYWEGPVEDFIKFGIRGRRKTQFESRLDRALMIGEAAPIITPAWVECVRCGIEFLQGRLEDVHKMANYQEDKGHETIVYIGQPPDRSNWHSKSRNKGTCSLGN